MRLKPEERVTYEVAKGRALDCMKETRRLYHASEVGLYIWPGCGLRSQGLGAAASRILKRMEGEGIVRQGPSSRNDAWGWFLMKGTAHYFASVEVNHSNECNCIICFPRNNCQDCKDCARHAYSDGTTPGFFYDKCEKHRRIIKSGKDGL